VNFVRIEEVVEVKVILGKRGWRSVETSFARTLLFKINFSAFGEELI
jgi:hypothetical protein